MPLFYRNFNTKDDIVKQYVQNIFNEYKWNDKLDTTYQIFDFFYKNKKIGIGSLSLLLVIIAFVWAFNIFGVCVGDHILATLNIPTWSNMANATGTHYTIFYSFIFLIPALILSIKYKDNLFTKVGKWLSITFIGILLLGFIFMVV